MNWHDRFLEKKMHFILSDKIDFHMIDNQSIADHTFTGHILMSFSEVEAPASKEGEIVLKFQRATI